MIATENFFDSLKDFTHPEIFADSEWLWEPLKTLDRSIESLIRENSGNAERSDALEGTLISNPADHGNARIGKSLVVTQWIEIKTPILLETLGILIGPGTVLEPSAILKGPMIIGANCEIRQGAYIRGNAIIGNHCVIGHATEIKNSIVMNHSEAGHFNYIGDSILGRHVNMGAGSRLANLQFRTAAEKDREEQIFPEIPALIEDDTVATGLNKFGAIIGDNVEVGCNAVLCPGALVGKDNWVYPNSVLPKGYYPPGSILAHTNRKPKISGK
ncbi:MAG: glucose-1-phosphate thymidylyltransferase [Nitrospinaceae bacterium]|nr:MAG: glucose-1-phosphate thymidylyltransferase [Nitrospinaceae bacterium]